MDIKNINKAKNIINTYDLVLKIRGLLDDSKSDKVININYFYRFSWICY